MRSSLMRKSAAVQKLLMIVGTALASVFTVSVATVQAQEGAPKTIVTFAAVQEIGAPGEVAVVIRRATGEPRNLILLRAGKATLGDVATALGVLAQRRDDDSDVLSSPEERTTLKAGSFSTEDRNQIIRLLDILSSLNQAPTRTIQGVGEVPAINVPLGLVRVKKPRS